MANYQDGKIYKIHSFQTDKIYIGSTTQLLCRRFSNHKTTFKRELSVITAKEILKYEDVMITLIENYPCNNKNELEKRERYYIENNNCVNKTIPTRTSKEYRDSNKDRLEQYRINRIEIRRQYNKQYRKDNKQNIKEYTKQYNKQYNKDNKQNIKVHNKQYYKDNKDTIIQKQKIYDKHRRSHFGIICKSYGIFH